MTRLMIKYKWVKWFLGKAKTTNFCIKRASALRFFSFRETKQ